MIESLDMLNTKYADYAIVCLYVILFKTPTQHGGGGFFHKIYVEKKLKTSEALTRQSFDQKINNLIVNIDVLSIKGPRLLVLPNEMKQTSKFLVLQWNFRIPYKPDA